MSINMQKKKETFELGRLRHQISETFNIEELKSLCFDLNVSYDGLAGEGLDGKARELISYCLRHGSLAQLIQYCAEQRPHLTWNRPAELEELQTTSPSNDNLLTLYKLVKAYNHNRQLSPSAERTFAGDDIAYTMREIAPRVFGQLPIDLWLNSTNAGKRLAAVKYLGWLQDTEFTSVVLERLASESPFLQFHIMLTLYSMADQFDTYQQDIVRNWLETYTPPDGSSRQYWKEKLLVSLNNNKSDAPV